MTYSQMLDTLNSSDEFKMILNTLTLKVNSDGKGASIAEKEGDKVTNLKLEKIYRFTKKTLKANISYLEFIDVLRDLIFDNLDDETLELLYNEEEFRLNGTTFLEGHEENLSTILSNLENNYFRYETICEILKENFNLDISVKDTRLAKFLTELGYKKIRKRIEGKQQNVWVKVN